LIAGLTGPRAEQQNILSGPSYSLTTDDSESQVSYGVLKL